MEQAAKQKRNGIGRFLAGITGGARRFSVALGFGAAVTLIQLLCQFSLSINGLKLDEEFGAYAWFSLAAGMALSAALELIFEGRGVRFAKLWECLICVPVSVGLFLLLYLSADSKGALADWASSALMITGGIILVSFFIGLAVVSRRGSEGSAMRAVVYGLFWANFLFSIVFGALMVFYLAVDSLIVSVKIDVMLVFLAFASMCVACPVFLSFLPGPGTERPKNRAYSIYFTYILTPLYWILLLILYIYIVLIAVRWEMPSGEMNPFGMAALGCFVALWLALRGEDSAFAKFFCRFGGLLVLPVTAVQILALMIRIRAYGLTPARVVSLVLVLLGLVGIAFSLFRVKLRVFFLVAAALAFLALISPVNVVQTANFDQELRLKNLMNKYGMLGPDGSIVPPDREVSEEDRKGFESGFNYFGYASGILSPYMKNVRELKSASSVIGDTPSSLKNESKYYWFYFDRSCSLSLDGKAEMVRVAESDLIFSDAVPVWTDPNTGREYPVDLRPLIRELMKEADQNETNSASGRLILELDPDHTLVIGSIEVSFGTRDGSETLRIEPQDCWMIICKEPGA